MKIVAGVNSSELSQEGREPYRNSVRINSARLLCTGADVSNLGTQVPAEEEAIQKFPYLLKTMNSISNLSVWQFPDTWRNVLLQVYLQIG